MRIRKNILVISRLGLKVVNFLPYDLKKKRRTIDFFSVRTMECSQVVYDTHTHEVIPATIYSDVRECILGCSVECPFEITYDGRWIHIWNYIFQSSQNVFIGASQFILHNGPRNGNTLKVL